MPSSLVDDLRLVFSGILDDKTLDMIDQLVLASVNDAYFNGYNYIGYCCINSERKIHGCIVYYILMDRTKIEYYKKCFIVFIVNKDYVLDKDLEYIFKLSDTISYEQGYAYFYILHSIKPALLFMKKIFSHKMQCIGLEYSLIDNTALPIDTEECLQNGDRE